MLLGARLPGLWIDAVHRGVSPHACDANGLLASHGARLLRVHDAETQHLGGPPVALLNRQLARVPWLGPALRCGVHVARVLPDGALLAITAGSCWRGDPNPRYEGTFGWSRGLVFQGFRRPARQGVLVDGARVWIAQYDLNRRRRQAMAVFRSDDAARTFVPCHRFSPGDVRHIHFIQRDPYTGHLWLGTGDRDAESRLLRSEDAGDTWQVVVGGGQRCRAMALAFQRDTIVWGTDAGTDAGAYRNRLLQLDRASGTIMATCWVQGPVHSVLATEAGDLWAVTAVEGGANEVDDRVHVWHSHDGVTWRECASFRRGLQPRRAQYAVGHLVAGQAPGEVWIGLRGVLAGDVVCLRAHLRG